MPKNLRIPHSDSAATSTIFYGVQKSTHLEVAIKVSKNEPNLTEIKVYEQMSPSRQSTVKLFDWFSEGGNNFIVTRRQSDRDLLSYMRKHCLSYLTEKELTMGAPTIFKALKALHDQGYLHNAIQPSHIYLHAHRCNDMDCKVRLRVRLGGFSKTSLI